MQAPLFDGFSFDPFSLLDDRFYPAEVGIGGCDVFQALVVALVIVIFDERLNLRFQIAGQIIVLQQDAVLEGLVPTLDLALCLRMECCTAYMLHILVSEIVGELACDIAGAIVR